LFLLLTFAIVISLSANVLERCGMLEHVTCLDSTVTSRL